METTQAVLQWLDQWISAHPTLAGLLVFLVAFSESLLIVGILVPGAALMIGIGILIANGSLPLASTLLWAVAGAIAGDGLSFWLGYHFRDTLPQWRLMRRYHRLFAHGRRFFERHGGKSVVFGRFVGPVRAIIPTIAGLMAMPPWRFFLVNVISALLWAPVYLLPGLILGATLELATEVTLRLVALVLVLMALFLLIRWLVRTSYRVLAPRTGRMITRLLQWARRHPLGGRIVTALIDPRRPESPVLTGLALSLLLAGVLFFVMLWQAGNGHVISGLDGWIYRLLQGLRTPAMDSIMTAVTMLGEAPALTGVSVTGLLWLWRHGQRAAVWHWLAAIAFGGALVLALKSLLAVPRPTGAVIAGFSFPSSHTTLALLVYGFAAIVIARGVERRWRYPVYLCVTLLVTMIGLSRLYLGAHWFSDVAGGFGLGLVWLAVVGIAWQRHSLRNIPAARLATWLLLALLVAGGGHIVLDLERQTARYQPRHPVGVMPAARWRNGGWRSLPAWREDLGLSHRHPLTLQWAGRLQDIRAWLTARGWRPARRLRFLDAVHWLHPQPDIARMPVMPHVHAGRYETLAMVRPVDRGRQLVLRLWRTRLRIDGKVALWIGNVTCQRLVRRLYLFSYPATTNDFDAPLRALLPVGSGHGLQAERRQRKRRPPAGVRWDGSVWLIRLRQTRLSAITASLRQATPEKTGVSPCPATISRPSPSP